MFKSLATVPFNAIIAFAGFPSLLYVNRDCNYLLGLRVEPGPGDQVSVGVAAVDTSLKVVQERDIN
jgi:hypothetical protein